MTDKNPMNRRRFLKGTGALAAGTLALPYVMRSSAHAQQAKTGPSDRVTLGCIGVGGRGTGNMRALMEDENVRVLAVCDVREKQRQTARAIVDRRYGDGGCVPYVDFRDVLARKDIDAVVICPQDHWHAVMAVAAARTGKDMYCEKPLGVSVVEGQAIRHAVRTYRRILQTGTQQRSDRKFRFACELARSGYLGKLHTVKVGAPGPEYKRTYQKPPSPEPLPPGLDYDMYVGPSPMKPYNGGRLAWPDWYLIWDYCAGFIVNWGVHHLDIAHWGCPAITSEPCELECRGSYRTDGLTDNINDWRAEFSYASGFRMTYTDTGNPNKQGCQFEGDKGWVHVNRSGIWAEPASLLRVKLRPDDIHLYESTNHYTDFIDCVRNRRDPVSPVEAGHTASYLGLIAEIAARLKRKLTWDPIKEEFIGDSEANALRERPYRKPWKL